MRASIRALLAAALLLAPLTALAQTYTPKTIRVDAPANVDTAEALRTAALPSGQPLTKQQIETGLQRLVDTGLFSAISYTVNSDALVIKLTPSASAQLQPVHFSNFVWWQPAELESLVEARVPGYHGQLPAVGSLTDQVEAALIDLLKTKGVDAKVDELQNGLSASSVTFSITSPSIVIDQVNLENQLPELKRPLKTFADSLHSQDFDLAETTLALHDSVTDIYRNAGYLDVSVPAPTISAPHKDLLNYAVDLTAAIQPGDLYTVHSVTIPPTPPIASADVAHAANLPIGSPASAAALRLAKSEIIALYAQSGYLDTRVTASVAKYTSTHTIDYTFDIAPGAIFTLSSFDTSALTPQQQQAFLRSVHTAPGAVVDRRLQTLIGLTLNQLHITPPRAAFFLDRPHHTVVIAVGPTPPHPTQ